MRDTSLTSGDVLVVVSVDRYRHPGGLMRSSRFISVCIVAGIAAGVSVIACGGGGGGGPKLIDAKTGGGSDAKVFMDAGSGSAGLKGLGQKCMAPADCPTNAPECIGPTGGN